MAKSKNHTNHNQNSKAHRNGITKPKTNRTPSMRGCDQKYLKNLRYSKKHNKKAEDLPRREKKTRNLQKRPWNVRKAYAKELALKKLSETAAPTVTLAAK